MSLYSPKKKCDYHFMLQVKPHKMLKMVREICVQVRKKNECFSDFWWEQVCPSVCSTESS